MSIPRNEHAAFIQKRVEQVYAAAENGFGWKDLAQRWGMAKPPVVAGGGMSLDEIYAMFPNLEERRFSQGTRLSGGEQQMLAIARAMMAGDRSALARSSVFVGSAQASAACAVSLACSRICSFE